MDGQKFGLFCPGFDILPFTFFHLDVMYDFIHSFYCTDGGISLTAYHEKKRQDMRTRYMYISVHVSLTDANSLYT